MIRATLGWLAAAVLIAGCQHLPDLDPFPAKYRRRLAAHPRWVTVTSFVNPPRSFPPAEVWALKHWEVAAKGRSEVTLRETHTSSLLGVLEKTRRRQPQLVTFRADRAVNPAVFFPHDKSAAAFGGYGGDQRYRFRDVDDDRFEIVINGGAGRVIFMPVPDERAVFRNPWPSQAIGLWTTPFGAESEVLAFLRDQRTDSRASQKWMEPAGFLHHDLTAKRRVAVSIDLGVPEAAVEAAANVVARWNEAVGGPLFELEVGRRPLNRPECLTGFRVCIRWSGAAQIPATGANGYTELAFDPKTGLIVGAVVSLLNDDAKPPLKPLPRQDLDAFLAPNPDNLADAILEFARFDRVAHPQPVRYLEYLLLHEFGHVLGLGHNFLADAAGGPDQLPPTVMTYPPFPLAWRMNKPGREDLRRIKLLYGDLAGGKRQPESGEAAEFTHNYCSTFDALVPVPDDTGLFRKRARCDVFVAGAPADWYLSLARRGRFSVFTPYPDLSHLSEDVRQVYRQAAERRGYPPLNVLTRLGYILADKDPDGAEARGRIRRYLCALPEEAVAIKAQLRDYHGYNLPCP